MVALWKIVEIGRYEGVLCVSSDRRHSRPEDQAPDLLQMTEKRCASSFVAYGRARLHVSLITLCVSSDRKCSRQVDQVVDHDG